MTEKRPNTVRFTADVMLGSLAQYLLLSGLDCSYHEQIDDSDLIQLARREDRVLLTRDRQLVESAPPSVTHMLFSNQDVRDQIRELKDRFQLKINENTLFTRCTICNRSLQAIPPEQARPDVPPQSWDWKDQFYRCPECNKVYWKGTHYREVRDRLKSWGILDPTP